MFLRKDCSPTFHGASTAEALPKAAAVKVAMFVNREVEHVKSDLEPESLKPVDTDRPLTPYNVSSLEPVVTAKPYPTVPPAAPPNQPHRDEGVLALVGGSRHNLDPHTPVPSISIPIPKAIVHLASFISSLAAVERHHITSLVIVL
jgi:hypothetical protein